MTAPPLTFLIPPSFGEVHDDGSPRRPGPHLTHALDRGHGPESAGAATMRMTRGAREAATGMKLAAADIQRCLDAPDDVSPDEKTPSRTRFRRGSSSSSPAPTGWCSGSTAAAADRTVATARRSARRASDGGVPAGREPTDRGRPRTRHRAGCAGLPGGLRSVRPEGR
jgi:hypothetical protein